MPATPRRHPVVTFAVLLAVLAGTVGLASYVSKVRLNKTQPKLDAPRQLGAMTIALPSGWASVKPSTDAELIILNEPAAKPAFPSRERSLSVSLYHPAQALPPGRFLSLLTGLTPTNYQAINFGDFPGLYIGTQTRASPNSTSSSPADDEKTIGGPADKQDEEKTIAHSLFAAATLPSGRIVLLRLEGPGFPVIADLDLLTAIAKSVRLANESPRLAGTDAIDFLRNQPLGSVFTRLADGTINDYRQTSDTLIVQSAPTEISTIQIHPAYLPALANSSSGESSDQTPTIIDPEELGHSEWAARHVLSLSDPAFLASTPKRLSGRRLLFTPDMPKSEPPVLGMVVWSESSPNEAALLIARGPIHTDAILLRLINRAADAVTFARKPDEFPTLLADGTDLAKKLAAVPVSTHNDLVLLWKHTQSDLSDTGIQTNTNNGSIIGWTRFSPDATVETRRDADGGFNARRSKHELKSLFGTAITRGQWNTNAFSDDVYEPHSRPPALSITREAASKDPGRALAQRANFVPAHRLLDAIPLAGQIPALITTDAVPWLDVDSVSDVWFTIVSPVPNQKDAWYLHVLGSGVTFIAKYEGQNLKSLHLLGGPTATVFSPAAIAIPQLPAEGPLAPSW